MSCENIIKNIANLGLFATRITQSSQFVLLMNQLHQWILSLVKDQNVVDSMEYNYYYD